MSESEQEPSATELSHRAAARREKIKLCVEIIGVVAVSVSVVLASCGLLLDVRNRQDDRVQAAWSQVSAGVGVKGALEYLNRHNEDLSNVRFREVSLKGIDLRGARLMRADFWGADLTGADLEGADLERAFLVRANLSGARFDRANLDRADFSEAVLDSASLRGAMLLRTRFVDVKMNGVSVEGAVVDGAMFERTPGLTKQQIVEEARVARPSQWPPN